MIRGGAWQTITLAITDPEPDSKAIRAIFQSHGCPAGIAARVCSELLQAGRRKTRLLRSVSLDRLRADLEPYGCTVWPKP